MRKRTLPSDRHRTIGLGLLQVPRWVRFLMSEVPLQGLRCFAAPLQAAAKCSLRIRCRANLSKTIQILGSSWAIFNAKVFKPI